MKERPERRTETNTNHVTNSTLHGSPVVAGSQARVVVNSQLETAEEREALSAVAELRAQLSEALAALGRSDDQTRESLQLVSSRLDGLEEELRAGSDQRDPERTKKLLTGIRDTVAGLAGIVSGVDGLWVAVQSVLR